MERVTMKALGNKTLILSMLVASMIAISAGSHAQAVCLTNYQGMGFTFEEVQRMCDEEIAERNHQIGGYTAGTRIPRDTCNTTYRVPCTGRNPD